MELEELKNKWNEQNKKLNESLRLNEDLIENVKIDKTKSKMYGLLIKRIAEAIVFFIIVMMLGTYIGNNFTLTAPVISALVLFAFSIVGLSGSIGQIFYIMSIDYEKPVVEIQKDISRVRTHSIQILRLILLSVPFYTAYIFLGAKIILGFDLFTSADDIWLITQAVFSVILLFPTFWLVRELGRKTNKKWLKGLLDKLVGSTTFDAVRLLEDLNEFKTTGN